MNNSARRRPRRKRDEMRSITMSLPRRLLEQVDLLADRERRSRAAMCELLVEIGVSKSIAEPASVGG